MLISPPFLPVLAGNPSDEDFVRAAMPVGVDLAPDCGGAPAGSYPLTTSLTWHNGIHLQAPRDGQQQHLPVRAIADGTVIFRSEPSPVSAVATHAQNCNVYGHTPAWTDNGMLILRHETEIGARPATQNQPVTLTKLVFYSVYMHLGQIEAGAAVGQRVYRKDKIGEAGQLIGVSGHIHFEICCDEANLQHLLGSARPLAWQEPNQPPTADGRTDSVFGSTFIYLPAGTPTSVTAPTNHLRTTAPATTLGEPLWVQITYGPGNGPPSSASNGPGNGQYSGDAVLRTFDIDGRPVGQEIRVNNFEYDMYEEAKRLHASLGKAVQPMSSPSGWYGLLRFGRDLGTDPLPTDAAHWRQIHTSNGTVWADLNALGTFKFSDADFLPVMGWHCIADDTSKDDQRCDSPMLKRLIRDPQHPESVLDPVKLAARLSKAEVRDKLQRVICNFPCEWDRQTIEKRYAWLQTHERYRMGDAAWKNFVERCRVLSFDTLPEEYKRATWHFHPQRFIAHMRKCMWLSESELVQLVPTHAIRTGKDKASGVTGALWEPVPSPLRQLQQNRRTPQPVNVPDLVRDHRVPLNRMMRKYGISTPLRQASFLGNSIQETEWLKALRERGGESYWYAPWYGRGFLQLTHPSNYIAYWEWRGRITNAALKRALILAQDSESKKSPGLRSKSAMQDANFQTMNQVVLDWRTAVQGFPLTDNDAIFAPTDSAGFYWASLRIAKYADEPHLLQRVVVQTANQQGAKIYYRSPAFWRASAAVNLPSKIASLYDSGLNGFDSRCSAYGHILAVLAEINFPDARNLAILERPDGAARRFL